MTYVPGADPDGELDEAIRIRLPQFEDDGFVLAGVMPTGEAALRRDETIIYLTDEATERERTAASRSAVDNRLLLGDVSRTENEVDIDGSLVRIVSTSFRRSDVELQEAVVASESSLLQIEYLLAPDIELRSRLAEAGVSLPDASPATDDQVDESARQVVRTWPPETGGLDGVTIVLAVLAIRAISRVIRDHFGHGVVIDGRTGRPFTIVELRSVPRGTAIVVRDDETVVLNTGSSEFSDLLKLLG